jgi:hypothetical protein
LDDVKTYNNTLCRHQKFQSSITQNQEGENDEDIRINYMVKAQSMIESQELKYKLFASLVWTAGVGPTKTDAHVTYGLRFGHSRCRWKSKDISFPTQLIPRQNTLRIDNSRHNKMTCRICQKSRIAWPPLGHRMSQERLQFKRG